MTSIRLLTIALVLLSASVAHARQALTVVSAGPQGEAASLEQANEIRIVFSEPMVTLGPAAGRVAPSYVRIAPAIPGEYRWSGTTILIFTPDPKRPLPFATTYEVTVDRGARALSGRTLAAPFTFRFTTPTVKLLETHWYRRGGTVAGAMVVMLRFNQPVRPADIAAHLRAELEPHDWAAPSFTVEEEARLRAVDPGGLDRFRARVRETLAVAKGGTPVALRVTSDWDRKAYPPSPDLVALETTTPVRPESWVRLTLAADVPSAAGPARPGQPEHYTIQAEPAFFIQGFRCRAECDGDAWNPIELRTPVKAEEFGAALTVADLTGGERPVPRKPGPRPRREYELDVATHLTLEDAGFDAQPPNRTYAVTARPTLRAADGQVLGYTWVGIVDNWHMRAFTSFGGGEGLWEKDGGGRLPFYARNLRLVTEWAAPLSARELMPAIRRLKENAASTPPGPGTERRLTLVPDRIESHGLDISRALRTGGTGLVWAAVREGEPLERTRRFADTEEARTKTSVVQVTNLGITVKDSPLNTLVFVTRLDNGAPVAGAAVSIVRLDNSVAWRGTTAADGTAIAPPLPLRPDNNVWSFAFLVTAEKDGDIAYTGSDWNEGIQPWNFNIGVNLAEAAPLLRGTVFTDRGVYRLGEEVQFKAILRHNAADGVRLLPGGTRVLVTVRDGQYRLVDERVVPVNAWSSAEWTLALPGEGTLGNYSVRAILESDRPKPRTPEQRDPAAGDPGPEEDEYVPGEKSVQGSFLVAAYRRPDFRVDVTLTGGRAIAGDALSATVTARYLFGAPMGPRPVTWRYTRSAAFGAPRPITERFGDDRWVFVGHPERDAIEKPELRRAETTLGAGGDLKLTLDTPRDVGLPYVYTLEGDVEDVSRQRIANRASLTVHPAPWYIGVRRPPYFLDQKAGLRTEIVAAGLDGTPQAGVPVEVTLTQVQWTSVRRAEGNGFYTWDTERKDVPAGSWSITTTDVPVPLDVPLPNGGYFILEARGRTPDGRSALTTTSFYVLGDGYTAWARFDHNRIDLVPERQTYKPGDTARIMIQSPWEQATALVTTEREGVRSHRTFVLTSTQQSIDVPITEADIPNLFVSVLLVKGRSAPAAAAAAEEGGDTSDPGKPSFRLGYVELNVEDRSRRLTLTVAADRAEYRPAESASLSVDVKDQAGRGTESEVTLWAVDYGVLSLTGYRTPDVLGSVYVRKALQVMTADNRQRIISRRVMTPKGETEGGGGGGDAGAGTLRRDFRVLAFWLGSVTTDASGRARVDVKLPESLTTYRIMAVAGDRRSRFGSADTEVRTNKPLTLKPAFPRFMTVGDRASFGAVVGSQLAAAGAATVTLRSLDPQVLAVTGRAEQTIDVPPGGNLEVRFDAEARAVGRARVQMTVRLGKEADAFEDVIPVEVLVAPETVAAYGEATADRATASEAIALPASTIPGFGGLRVEMASTALVGLGEGARYLVEYPYGCAEQRASRALALLLAADLGEAFTLPGIDPRAMKPAVQQTVGDLARYQCESGGFSYWPGRCDGTSPYLTAYVLSVLARAASLGYTVDRGMRSRGLTYLERELAVEPPVNDGWWPAYTAWQAFAVKVLAEGGRNQDSHITRLYGHRDRMPVFALAYLYDAMAARGGSATPRAADLRRRMVNAVLTEAGASHVEELSDPYLLWFWNSNVRSTAIVLDTLVRAGATDAPVRQMVRWMMQVRRDGRWGNTQENAHAMDALVSYYRRLEPEIPSFTAVARLGQAELAREEFRGRSTTAEAAEIPLARVLASGAEAPLTFAREGTGTLFYTARLRYALDAPPDALDAGFRIERRYEPFSEEGARPAATTFRAGDLVRVTLTFHLPKERRFVAVTDPLPA